MDCGNFGTKCHFSGHYAQLLSITVSGKCKEGLQMAKETSFCNHPAVEPYVMNTVGFVHPKKERGGGEA